MLSIDNPLRMSDMFWCSAKHCWAIMHARSYSARMPSSLSPTDLRSGSLSSCLASTDDLEEDIADVDTIDEEEEDNWSYLEVQSEHIYSQSTPTKNLPERGVDISPVRDEHVSFVISPQARNVPHKLKKRIEPNWRERTVSVRKFVDDNLQIDKINMTLQRTYIKEGKTFKNPRAVRTEKMFRHISACLLYTSPSPRDKRQSRMPSSA